MAKEFYPHQIVQIFEDGRNTCPDDRILLKPFDENDPEMQSDKAFCPKCFKVFDLPPNWERSVMASRKKDYDVQDNFEKIIDQFEGKIQINIPPTTFEEFDEILKTKGWEKEKIVKKDIIYMLKETENSKFYPHSNRVGYLYSGIPLPDLSNYRSKLRIDYEDYIKEYAKLEKDRDSALNGLYVLCRLLQRHGYPAEIDDFKPTISESTLNSYDRIWDQICERLGW